MSYSLISLRAQFIKAFSFITLDIEVCNNYLVSHQGSRTFTRTGKLRPRQTIKSAIKLKPSFVPYTCFTFMTLKYSPHAYVRIPVENGDR